PEVSGERTHGGSGRRGADAALVAALAGGATAAGAAAAAGVSRRTVARRLAAGSDAVRLGAARAVLELGASLRRAEELEARLAVIEERQAEEREARRW